MIEPPEEEGMFEGLPVSEYNDPAGLWGQNYGATRRKDREMSPGSWWTIEEEGDPARAYMTKVKGE